MQKNNTAIEATLQRQKRANVRRNFDIGKQMSRAINEEKENTAKSNNKTKTSKTKQRTPFSSQTIFSRVISASVLLPLSHTHTKGACVQIAHIQRSIRIDNGIQCWNSTENKRFN